MMVHMEDGYASLFIFTQAPSGEFFNEFKTILESVVYHYSTDEQIAETSKEAAEKENNHDNTISKSTVSSNKYLLLFLLLIPAAIAVFVFVKKHKAKQLSSPRIHSNHETKLPPAQADPSSTAILFCHKCGNRLAEGESVCRHCGTAIPSR